MGDPKVGAVVVGFDTTFTYSKNAYAIKCLHGNEGCLLIATNKDKTFPSNGVVMPGGGTVVGAVEIGALREADFTCGKPGSLMMDMICSTHKLDRSRTLMVGD